MRLKISIIMPVYNAEQYLSDAVNSVLEQSLTEFELILVDDGSTDNSACICDEYASKDERVRVIHQKNSGICAARNAGIAVARGEYIGFMDNDDILDIDTLKENYSLASAYNADWVKFGKTEILSVNGKVIKEKKTSFKEAIYDNTEIIKNLLILRAQDTMTFVWDSLIRREIIVNHKLSFDEMFKSGNEDIDLCEQIAMYANRLIVNPKCYYVHYTRMGISASSKYSEDKLNSYLYLLKKSNRRYEQYDIVSAATDDDYLFVVTKQIVANICQKLTDAGRLLTNAEKKAWLQRCKQDKEFARYNSIDAGVLRARSKKLFLYGILFQKECFGILLLLDKYSRKLVYKIRTIGVRK